MTKTNKKLYDADRYKAKKERILQQSKDYYLSNKEIIQKRHKQHLLNNKEYYKEYSARHYKNNMEYYRNKHLLRSYGINNEMYENMFNLQNGRCAICQESETCLDRRTGKIKKLAVDHDHKTGEVRQLVCSKHNRGIGLFEESPELLRAAADYLERHKK